MVNVEERKALNESTFRQANEHLERKVAAVVDGDETVPLPFLCECADLECTQVVLVTLDEYERVRSHPRHSLGVLGHEHLDVEIVVERNDRFLVTEKVGRAGEVAAEEDPRS